MSSSDGDRFMDELGGDPAGSTIRATDFIKNIGSGFIDLLRNPGETPSEQAITGPPIPRVWKALKTSIYSPIIAVVIGVIVFFQNTADAGVAFIGDVFTFLSAFVFALFGRGTRTFTIAGESFQMSGTTSEIETLFAQAEAALPGFGEMAFPIAVGIGFATVLVAQFYFRRVVG